MPRSRVTLPWIVLKKATRNYFADNGTFLAAGIAFNLLLYCVPFALLIVSALGYTLVGWDRAETWVQNGLRQLVPQSQTALFDTLAVIVARRTLLSVIGFLLLLYLGSRLFEAIRHALNVIFKSTRKRSAFKAKLVDIGMMLVVAGLMILSVGAGSALGILGAMDQRFPALHEFLKPWWIVATQFLIFIFTTALFYTLYTLAPAKSMSRRTTFVAALVGAVLFQVSKWLFSWYVSVAQTHVVFGALTGVIFFVLWLYYGCIVFVIGAEVGSALHEAQKNGG